MKTEYIILFILLFALPFGFLVDDQRAQNMVQDIEQKGFVIKDYEVPFFESGPFFRLKGSVIIKMIDQNDTVIWGRSGLFYNDYAYSDGSAID